MARWIFPHQDYPWLVPALVIGGAAILALRTVRPSYGVDNVHRAADLAGVEWDNNPAFMDMSERLTGKRHLDSMSPEDLMLVAASLEAGAQGQT